MYGAVPVKELLSGYQKQHKTENYNRCKEDKGVVLHAVELNLCTKRANKTCVTMGWN